MPWFFKMVVVGLEGGTIPFTNYFTLERETKFEKALSAMEIK